MNQNEMPDKIILEIKKISSKIDEISSMDDIKSFTNELISLFDGNDEYDKIENLVQFLESTSNRKDLDSLILMIIIYNRANESYMRHICDSINLHIYHEHHTKKLDDFIKKRIAMEPDEDFAEHYKDVWLVPGGAPTRK